MPLIWYTVFPRNFPHQLKNKDTPFQMEVVSMMLFGLKKSAGIDMDEIKY